jgi:uncharacterized protein (DUF1697 family)
MQRRIVLLRGINLGARNRIAMPALRELLEADGLKEVTTYLQSGNVVLSSTAKPETVARRVRRVIADGLGLDIEVVVRTRDELAAVVERDPLGDVAEDPKRYQVTFLSTALADDVVEKLSGLTAQRERFAAYGRELYAWHPDGVGSSKLAVALSGARLGVTATARNWTTVVNLLEMADG